MRSVFSFERAINLKSFIDMLSETASKTSATKIIFHSILILIMVIAIIIPYVT
jgi:hypothetical protein